MFIKAVVALKNIRAIVVIHYKRAGFKGYFKI